MRAELLAKTITALRRTDSAGITRRRTCRVIRCATKNISGTVRIQMSRTRREKLSVDCVTTPISNRPATSQIQLTSSCVPSAPGLPGCQLSVRSSRRNTKYDSSAASIASTWKSV